MQLFACTVTMKYTTLKVRNLKAIGLFLVALVSIVFTPLDAFTWQGKAIHVTDGDTTTIIRACL